MKAKKYSFRIELNKSLMTGLLTDLIEIETIECDNLPVDSFTITASKEHELYMRTVEGTLIDTNVLSATKFIDFLYSHAGFTLTALTK